MSVNILGGGLEFDATIDDSNFQKKTVELQRTLNSLKIQAESYKRVIESTQDRGVLTEFNRKLQQSQSEISRLRNAGKQGFDELGNQIEKNTGFLGKFKGGLLAIGSALGITFAISGIIQFGKELFGIAQQAEGIELAFSRITNSQQVLENLRVATKNEVSELKLMQQAVKASDFQIPMDVLAKGLAFAQQKAKDTGKDVDYLVNSFVDGIGRKSIRIIDNLNISQAEVQKELKKTGDFATAVGNVIDRQMGLAGTQVDTLSSKTNRLATTWENAKNRVAGFFKALFNPELADPKKIAQLTDQYSKSYSKFGTYTSEQQKEIIANTEKVVADQAKAYNEAKKKYDSGTGTAYQDLTLAKEGERLKALQNVLSNLKAQNKEVDDLTRRKKGLLSIEELQKDLADLILKRDNETNRSIINTLNTQIDARQKQISALNGSSAKKQDKDKNKALEKTFSERKRILEQIDGINNEYNRKSLSKDEAEIQAVRDKFKKIQATVYEFNNNPKNKGVSIDGTVLDKTRDKAINDLKYDQQTEALKVSLEQRKDLYADYEAYKNQVGEDKAKERFANELKIINETESNAVKELAGLLAISATGSLTANQQKRFNIITADLKKKFELERTIQDKSFIDALNATKTFEDEKLAIEAKYAKIKDDLLLNKDKLGAGEYAKKVAIANEQQKEETDKVNETQLLKTEALKAFYDGVDEMSSKSARTVIDNAKTELEASNLSAKAKAKILKDLDSASKAIEERLPKKLISLAQELGNVANQIKPIDEGFADVLGTVANVIGSVGQIKQSVIDLKNLPKGDILGGITAGLGIAGAGIGIITSIASIFKKSSEERKKAEREQIEYSNQLQLKAIEAQSKAMERQLALIKDLYGTERIAKYGESIESLKQKIVKSAESAQDQLLFTGDKKIDELVTRLNSGESMDKIFRSKFNPLDPKKTRYIEDFFDKVAKGNASKLSIDLSKGADEIERLQQLLENGKLDETTAANVQSLITYTKQYQDTLNALKAETTGSTFEEIGNEIVDMFSRGETSAEDFGKSFQNIMQKYLLNTFKGQVLDKALQDYYNKFDEFAQSGGVLDATEKNTLQGLYTQILEDNKKKFEQLQEVTGIDLTAGTDAPKSNLQGSIKRELTEQTGSELAGLYRSGYDLSKQSFNEIAAMRSITQKHLDISMQGIIHLRNIESNTGATVEELKSALSELKGINQNTKPVQSARSLGI